MKVGPVRIVRKQVRCAPSRTGRSPDTGVRNKGGHRREQTPHKRQERSSGTLRRTVGLGKTVGSVRYGPFEVPTRTHPARDLLVKNTGSTCGTHTPGTPATTHSGPQGCRSRTPRTTTKVHLPLTPDSMSGPGSGPVGAGGTDRRHTNPFTSVGTAPGCRRQWKRLKPWGTTMAGLTGPRTDHIRRRT